MLLKDSLNSQASPSGLKFTNMTSYKDLVRVFQEPFFDHNGKAELRAHPGGKILVNPSDCEAKIGHKGVGYQAQVTETEVVS